METLDEETVEALRQAFSAFDEDGSGTIDLQELQNVLKMLNVENVSPEQVERKFRQFDTDGSGTVEWEEFKAIFLGLTHRASATADEAKAILCKRVLDRSHAQLQKLASYLIATQPFFKQLRPDVVQDVSRYLQYDEIEKGEWVMKQGERGDHMYILVSGACDVYVNKAITRETLSQSLARTKTLAKESSALSHSLARTLSKAGSALLNNTRSLNALNPTLSRMESLNQGLEHKLSGSGGSALFHTLSPAGSTLAHAFAALARTPSSGLDRPGSMSLKAGSLQGALAHRGSSLAQGSIPGKLRDRQATLRWGDTTGASVDLQAIGEEAPLRIKATSVDPATAAAIAERRKQRRAAVEARHAAESAMRSTAPVPTTDATPSAGDLEPAEGENQGADSLSQLDEMAAEARLLALQAAGTSPPDSVEQPAESTSTDGHSQQSAGSTAQAARGRKAGTLASLAQASAAVAWTAEMARERKRSIMYGEAVAPIPAAEDGGSHDGPKDDYSIEEAGTCVASMGPGDCMGEKALLTEGGTRTASIHATTHCEVLVLHRTTFASMVKNMGGRLLYHPDYLARLLATPPAQRNENDVLKLASILVNLPRFVDVPREQLELICKQVEHEPHPAHSVVVKQGDDGDCMYVILQGSCNVHINPDDDSPPAKAAATKAPVIDAQAAKNSLSVLSAAVKQQRGNRGSMRVGGKQSIKLLTNLLSGESGRDEDTKPTVNLLERQFGPVCRHLTTGAAFGEVSLAARKMVKRTGTVITTEPCSLVRISKETYQKTLLETQLKATAEKVEYFKKVAIFEGAPARVLTQMHFLTESRSVPRGHVLCLEGQPPVGMFFIVTGQIIALARMPGNPRPHGNPIGVEDTLSSKRPSSARAWDGSAAGTAGPAGALSARSVSGRPTSAQPKQRPRLSGRFQAVAILGPADFVGEDAIATGSHQFTTVTATDCTLLWLKPQEMHMMGQKAMQNLLQYSKLRGSWRMADRQLVWQPVHWRDRATAHAKVAAAHVSAASAKSVVLQTMPTAANLAVAHAPQRHAPLASCSAPHSTDDPACDQPSEPRNAEPSNPEPARAQAAPAASPVVASQQQAEVPVVPALPPPSETQQDIRDYEEGCQIDQDRQVSHVVCTKSATPRCMDKHCQLRPGPRSAASIQRTLRAVQLQLTHYHCAPQAAVMSKVQYLQSVLDGPAYWSVGAASMHKRQPQMARIAVQVPQEPLQRSRPTLSVRKCW